MITTSRSNHSYRDRETCVKSPKGHCQQKPDSGKPYGTNSLAVPTNILQRSGKRNRGKLPMERDPRDTSLLPDLICISNQTNGYYTYIYCNIAIKMLLKHSPRHMQGMTYKDKERGDVGILCWGHPQFPQLPGRWSLLWMSEIAAPILRARLSSSHPGLHPLT